MGQSERPIEPGDRVIIQSPSGQEGVVTRIIDGMPYVLADGLSQDEPMARARLQRIVGTTWDTCENASNVGCESCMELIENDRCTGSQRECGHHCNHSWSHEACCWCDKTFGEVAGLPMPARRARTTE